MIFQCKIQYLVMSKNESIIRARMGQKKSVPCHHNLLSLDKPSDANQWKSCAQLDAASLFFLSYSKNRLKGICC